MLKRDFYLSFFSFSSIFAIIMLNDHPAIVPFLISEHAQHWPGGLEINDYGSTRINANNSLPKI